jgi:hypothetical protein
VVGIVNWSCLAHWWPVDRCGVVRPALPGARLARSFGPSLQCLLWSEQPWDRPEGQRSNSADTTAQVSRVVDRATQTRGSDGAAVATDCET